MTAERLNITIDGSPLDVLVGTSVAAAIIASGRVRFRDSVAGRPRGPLCAMGTCFECVVSVDEQRRVRSCLIECKEGMEVRTHDRPP